MIPNNPDQPLRLVLKTEFYRAIESGEKKSEWRDATPYWTERLTGREVKAVTFSRGYSTGEEMTFEVKAIECVEVNPATAKVVRNYALDAVPHYDPEEFAAAMKAAFDEALPGWKFYQNRNGILFEVRVPCKKEAEQEKAAEILDAFFESQTRAVEVVDKGLYPS